VLERVEAVGRALARVGRAEDGLRVAVTVALASESLSKEEHEVLSRIARAGGLDSANVDAIIDQVKQELGAAAETGR
jgi:tellurite resistance protein